MKKILAILLACMMIFSFSMSVYADEEALELSDGAKILKNAYSTIQEDMDVNSIDLCKEQVANLLYNDVLSSMLVSELNGMKIYEETYGGAYIQDGELVVCVTDNSSETYNQLSRVDSAMSTKVVNYSYNELSAAKELLLKEYQEYYQLYCIESYNAEIADLIKSIQSVELVQEDNCVLICLDDCSEEKILLFQSVFTNNTCFEFYEDETDYVEYTTWQPGQHIQFYSPSLGSYQGASTGYRAYYVMNGTTYYGFVTSAHKMSLDYPTIQNESWENLGQIIDLQFAGTVDAAFVSLDEPYKMTNVAYYAETEEANNAHQGDEVVGGSWYTARAEGGKVYKVGRTTYRTESTIKSTDYACTVDGVALNNLTKTGHFADLGDSGGMVYGLYNNEAYVVDGIIQGGKNQGLFKYTAYVKASEIYNILGFTPW